MSQVQGQPRLHSEFQSELKMRQYLSKKIEGQVRGREGKGGEGKEREGKGRKNEREPVDNKHQAFPLPAYK